MERPTEGNKNPEGLGPNSPDLDEANESSTLVQHDAVFGTFTEGGPNYRNVCTASYRRVARLIPG